MVNASAHPGTTTPSPPWATEGDSLFRLSAAPLMKIASLQAGGSQWYYVCELFRLALEEFSI
jgi:hypothetical protein